MQPTEQILTYLPLLRAIQSIFEKYPRKGVIIGGIAVSLLGEARLTADVDALVLLSVADIPALILHAAEVGIYPRIKNADSFARTNRALLMVHQVTLINVDFILGMLPFEEEVLQRSHQITIKDILINLPTVEDLIIMKAVAQRPKDQIDIQGLVKLNPNLDFKRIEYWVRLFAESLDDPDLWDKTYKQIMRS